MPRKPILSAALATGVAVAPADAWPGTDIIDDGLGGASADAIYYEASEVPDLILGPDMLDVSVPDLIEGAAGSAHDDAVEPDIYLAQTIYGGGAADMLSTGNRQGNITLDNGIKRKNTIKLDNGINKNGNVKLNRGKAVKPNNLNRLKKNRK